MDSVLEIGTKLIPQTHLLTLIPETDLGKKVKSLYTNETFVNSRSNSGSGAGIGFLIYIIINMVICFTAFYFVFKCGGDFLDIVAACCCTPCYVVYRLAKSCEKPVVQYVQQVPIQPVA